MHLERAVLSQYFEIYEQDVGCKPFCHISRNLSFQPKVAKVRKVEKENGVQWNKGGTEVRELQLEPTFCSNWEIKGKLEEEPNILYFLIHSFDNFISISS